MKLQEIKHRFLNNLVLQYYLLESSLESRADAHCISTLKLQFPQVNIETKCGVPDVLLNEFNSIIRAVSVFS